MRLYCYYCKREDPGHSVFARFTVHDRRGCKHVCDRHAKWRMETSVLEGHASDCAFYAEPSS
jgi:hypothetical protein